MLPRNHLSHLPVEEISLSPPSLLSRIQLRAALTLAAAVLLAASALLLAAPARAQAVNYVALGDSYSSGLGAGSYSGGSCSRSSKAYPQLWDNSHAPASFSFVACAGATTTDVANSQLSAVSASTSLISITIGGNDVGFANVMLTCVLGSTSTCVSAINQAESEANTQLPGELDSLFSAISARAPTATVVVLGYPEFYDLAKSSTCIGLSTTDRTDLNQGADVLDTQIQAAAGRHGFRYADVRAAFAGHEICDSSSWLNSVDWFDLTASYHPTAAGQSGAYYPVFNAAAG
jgi:lysophospholipase L1-like esterase